MNVANIWFRKIQSSLLCETLVRKAGPIGRNNFNKIVNLLKNKKPLAFIQETLYLYKRYDNFFFFQRIGILWNGGVSCLLAKVNRRGNASNAARN